MGEENYEAEGLRLLMPYVGGALEGGALEVWPYLGTTANRSGLPSSVMAGMTWRVSESSADYVWDDIGDLGRGARGSSRSALCR
eukprot:3347758-Heterocapsa_arctica.AAC.1